jgi:hypothetical protein
MMADAFAWSSNGRRALSLRPMSPPRMMAVMDSGRISSSRISPISDSIRSSSLRMSDAVDGQDPAKKGGLLSKMKASIPPASERQKLVPLAIMFFCILFNYTILRDTKDVLMITAPKSGAEVIVRLFVKQMLFVCPLSDSNTTLNLLYHLNMCSHSSRHGLIFQLLL